MSGVRVMTPEFRARRHRGESQCRGCEGWTTTPVFIGHGSTRYCPECAAILREGGMDRDQFDLQNPCARYFFLTFMRFLIADGGVSPPVKVTVDKVPRREGRNYLTILKKLRLAVPSDDPF